MAAGYLLDWTRLFARKCRWFLTPLLFMERPQSYYLVGFLHVPNTSWILFPHDILLLCPSGSLPSVDRSFIIELGIKVPAHHLCGNRPDGRTGWLHIVGDHFIQRNTFTH